MLHLCRVFKSIYLVFVELQNHSAIFHGSKNDNFHLNLFDYYHIFAQNINRG